ncbi:MAG: Mucin-2 [Icmadophila ericetorum]|nr:Mucin-2 [Icmadophila ericetorum]
MRTFGLIDEFIWPDASRLASGKYFDIGDTIDTIYLAETATPIGVSTNCTCNNGYIYNYIVRTVTFGATPYGGAGYVNGTQATFGNPDLVTNCNGLSTTCILVLHADDGLGVDGWGTALATTSSFLLEYYSNGSEQGEQPLPVAASSSPSSPTTILSSPSSTTVNPPPGTTILFSPPSSIVIPPPVVPGTTIASSPGSPSSTVAPVNTPSSSAAPVSVSPITSAVPLSPSSSMVNPQSPSPVSISVPIPNPVVLTTTLIPSAVGPTTLVPSVVSQTIILIPSVVGSTTTLIPSVVSQTTILIPSLAGQTTILIPSVVGSITTAQVGGAGGGPVPGSFTSLIRSDTSAGGNSGVQSVAVVTSASVIVQTVTISGTLITTTIPVSAAPIISVISTGSTLQTITLTPATGVPVGPGHHQQESTTLGAGAIAGIVVGAIIGNVLLALGIFLLWRMRRRNREDEGVFVSSGFTRGPTSQYLPELDLNERQGALSPGMSELSGSTSVPGSPIAKGIKLDRNF